MIRVPAQRGDGTRIILRSPDPTCNPYLVLAALLCSIEQGLEARREPIAPLNDDRASGIDFPTDMLEAVRQMHASPAVNARLGEEFVMVYCENKRQDHLAFLNEINQREYRWYL
jgi:glutamine synthetase